MIRALRISLIFGVIAVWGCALLAQDAEYPPNKPFLRIETGTHTAVIKGVDVDAAGRYLVSASDDKTARVWDLRNGKLVRILRPPQGEEDVGKLYSVAVSPDGSTVALGGLTGASGSGNFPLYIFDRATGALRQRIQALPGATVHLAYSSDGRYLVAALHSSNGIRVFDTTSYREIARDTNYGNPSYWAEFDHAGRLVTASYDGLVRLYSADFQTVIAPAVKKEIPGGRQPFSARFSPDGSRIAVGFNDSTAVTLVSARDLSPQPSPRTPSGSGDLSKVAWSADGRMLCAGGRYRNENGIMPIYCWPTGSTGEGTPRPLATNTIRDLRFLPDGRLVFASGAPEVGVLDRSGAIVWENRPEILDLAIRPSDLRLSRDGRTVEFTHLQYNGGAWKRQFVRFSPEDRNFSVVTELSLSPPRTTGVPVENWHEKYTPTLNSRSLNLDVGEMSRSLAISQAGDLFVLGCSWAIRVYDHAGSQERLISVPGEAFAVNLPSDSRHIVAALSDGTVRWYETNTGREVLAFFLHRDLKRWIAWTPEGFFDASPGGENLIGYHLNHGPDHEGEFVKVDQLFDTFYRPDLVSQRLKPGGAEAIAAAIKKAGDIAAILHGGSPPEIRSFSVTRSGSSGDYVLQFQVVDRGGGIGNIVYSVDGRPVEAREASDIPAVGVANVRVTIPNVTPGERTFSVTASNGQNLIKSEPVSRQQTVPGSVAGSKMYVIAAGVSHYRNSNLNQGVQFAAGDANQIAARLQQLGVTAFATVIPYPLTDPTLANIEDKINSVAAAMGPNDAFVLYLAGHGTAVDGNYSFLPSDGQPLGQDRLQPLLKKIPGNKMLLLIDTCGSGALADRDPEMYALDRMVGRKGYAMLAGSRKIALEGVNNHGVFTSAVLEALEKARTDDQRWLRISGLAEYVQAKVPEITNRLWHSRQDPVVLLQGDLFAIARR